jgi:predicted alpha/beta-hydrolase family hydrolase
MSQRPARFSTEPLKLVIDDGRAVSGLFVRPSDAFTCYVLAHGAGAGMTHPFMQAMAEELAERGIATLRYQFPSMEQRTKRPDSPQVAQATVRAAVAEAARLAPELPLIAGGKSFGGRMTSQAQAVSPLAGVRGLVFLGFPLHPAGRPSDERAKHLLAVRIPMLFLQGTRDALASVELIQQTVARLGKSASLRLLENADHSFHVPARSGRTDVEVRNEMLDLVAGWAKKVIAETAGVIAPLDSRR